MTATTAPEFGELFQTAIPSGKQDDAGREIGFLVKLVDNGVDFHAAVQNARLVGRDAVSGEFVKFGAHQRSKKFTSAAAASAWAYSTARERIAKLK